MRLSQIKAAIAVLEPIIASVKDEKSDTADKRVLKLIKEKFIDDAKESDPELTRDQLIVLYRDLKKETISDTTLKTFFNNVKSAVSNEILAGNAFLLDNLDDFLNLNSTAQQNVLSLASYLNEFAILPGKSLATIFNELKPWLFKYPVQVKEALRLLQQYQVVNSELSDQLVQAGNLLTLQNIQLVLTKPADARIIAYCLCVLHEKELLGDANQTKLTESKMIEILASAITQLKDILTQDHLALLFAETQKPDCDTMKIRLLTDNMIRRARYNVRATPGLLLTTFSIHDGLPIDHGQDDGQLAKKPLVVLTDESNTGGLCPSRSKCSIG